MKWLETDKHNIYVFSVFNIIPQGPVISEIRIFMLDKPVFIIYNTGLQGDCIINRV